MLVLTRNIGDRINIGDDIVIEVKDIKNKKVSIGILAPEDTLILRSELAGGVTEYENSK